jgi:hypothetical protein
LNRGVTYRAPARTTIRRIRIRRIRAAGVLVLVAALAVLGYLSLAPPSSTIASPDAFSPGGERRPAGAPDLVPRRREHRRDLGLEDGAVPTGTTVFDDGVPGVANLDPALLAALRRAAADAAADGVAFVVDSGWRSAAYQQRLLDEAVSDYGSEQEAARWVATPATSAHVSGDAVDIGPTAGAAWLSARGAAYGLCQTYGNEPWHYELRPDAIDHGCGAMYADPTHDPRMRR